MPPPVDLNLLRAFVAVYDTGSFVAAGTKLGVPRSTLSRAIAALEETLGVTLFQRTTRRVSPTSAATALHERVASKVASLDASFGDLPDAEAEPSGTLRVTATTEFGAMVLAEAVARYAQRYPRARVEVKLTTAFVDLVKENVDVAIRFAGKRLADSTLVARKIGTVAAYLYASPSYLARRGTPRTPADLAKHDWVEFVGSPPLRLTDGVKRADVGRSSRVDVATRVRADSLWFMRETLKAGGGIGQLPSFLADPDVTAGNLVHVLPRSVALAGTVYLVHPASKHMPPRVTAFRDLLLEMLRQRPLGPPAR
jgi:DNA-binding transcriptional LysR family regulator